MRDFRRSNEFLAVTRAAQHVWAAIAFIFLWLHFTYVRGDLRHQDWQLYTLYFLSVAGIAARYLTGIRHGEKRWHRVAFDGLTIVFIALGVNLTGGIRSDLWLVYFIFVIAETLASGARGLLLTDAAAVVSYIAATWPNQPNQAYGEILLTRVFFLVLVASIARTLAAEERKRQGDLAALQEALSVSEERRRLARELHDGIGHTLTRVILSLELASRQQGAEPAEASAAVGRQVTALRGAMEEMRQVVATLRSDSQAFDLPALVRSLASQVSESGPLTVEVEMPDEPIPLSPHRQYHMARVIQEALTNCLRHSGSERAEVEVQVQNGTVGSPMVVAIVRDFGRGFDPDAAERGPGQGLRGMQERLEPFGGRVTLDSRPDGGTVVTAEMPADEGGW